MHAIVSDGCFLDDGSFFTLVTRSHLQTKMALAIWLVTLSEPASLKNEWFISRLSCQTTYLPKKSGRTGRV
ncbi:MAG: hypothetical protein R6V54_03695 [Desulfobacteraceae bacterium]